MRKIFNIFKIIIILQCFQLNEAKNYGNNDNYDINKLRTIYEWKSLDFAFPSQQKRQQAINNGDFNFGQIFPIDVDITEGNRSRIFLTIPRFQPGVPATLGFISNRKTLDGNPIIMPYPNWEWNQVGDCDHLTSVFRVKVDECGKLWILDSGSIMEKQICPPQILVFDLNSDRLISRYKIPSEQLAPTSLLIAITLDIRNSQCNEAFAYITDPGGFQLIVYDYKQKKSWNIRNNIFYPYPPYGIFNMDGLTFDLMDGLFGTALGPIRKDGDRILYFHSLASVVESWVPTSVIRNFKNFENNPDAKARCFKPFEGTRRSQAPAEAMTNNGILFYVLTHEMVLECWNSIDYPEYGGNNLEPLIFSKEKLIFNSGLKIRTTKDGQEELWLLTIPYHKAMNGLLGPNEVNFHILGGFVNELIRGTKCEIKH